MLKILNKGIQITAPLDTSDFTGDLETDSKLPYIQGLVGGRLVTITADGVVLADAAEAHTFVGLIINDASGYFMENKPALASGMLAISCGGQMAVSDQIVTSETFAIGDLLYLGSGAKAGLITKTKPEAPATVAPFGIAMSSASLSSPELTFVIV